MCYVGNLKMGFADEDHDVYGTSSTCIMSYNNNVLCLSWVVYKLVARKCGYLIILDLV